MFPGAVLLKTTQCIKLKRKDLGIELFVKNVLIIQHHFAMLDLETS